MRSRWDRAPTKSTKTIQMRRSESSSPSCFIKSKLARSCLFEAVEWIYTGTHTRKFFVSIQPPVGELMTPAFLTENDFKKEQGKLMGMNEISEKLTLGEKCVNEHVIVERVTATANLSRVPCGSDKECSTPPPPPSAPVYRFAGKTVSSGCLVLVTVATKEGGGAQLTVNCEKMVIGTMLVKDVMQALSQ
ncbi:AP-3 complex subunit beta-2-like [Puntigrus tetrazona]|uniref:AP-3 complex subunit beta-2-like n=1 Tax=Puntigrus tetrazona TaxID=1606681 RepID=UPI001C8A0524|nr:AP-3 complex subunit beta-2-like [Puntigrus tetrazona]